MSVDGRAKLWAKAKAEAPIKFVAKAPRPKFVDNKKTDQGVWSRRQRRESFPNYQSATQHIIKREFDKIVEDRERTMMRDVKAEMTGLIGEASRGEFPNRVVVFDSGWYDHRPGDPLPPIESFRISSR